MLGRLIPRDEKFFDLFDQLAAHLTKTTGLLNKLFSDPACAPDCARSIKDEEHAADLLMQTVSQRIDKSFITPIDREDIHRLASRLDDVIDTLDGVARRFEMLHVGATTPYATRMTDVLMRAGDRVQAGVRAIRKPALVNTIAGEVKRLEEEGDAIYHEAVGSLFAGNAGKPDPLEVLKWKEMYDTLEVAIDRCMGVAQVLQSIALKNA